MEALRQIKAEKAKKEPIKKNKRTAKGRYISQKAVIYEKTQRRTKGKMGKTSL